MALIRCPNCDTLHDLEGSFFASGARKVRCASCREIWEATDPESDTPFTVTTPKQEPNRAPVATTESAEPEAGDVAALDQSAIDAMDFSTPEPPQGEASAAEGADISAEDLEALFAEEAKPADAAQGLIEKSAPPAGEPIEFNPESLARAQDAEKDAASDAALEERRQWRRSKHLAATEAHHRAPVKARKSSSATVMLMAAGIGTLATIGILRSEAVRLFPGTAPIFEAVGLSVTPSILDIKDVRSRLVKEEGRETLEVTGTVVNLSPALQKLPVMRLSIRESSGQEIYVWTATADQAELGPGEKTVFRRRLASPPPESHSVMVRFVAKDDIVAAIR
jgi:predicted Zn finger-like uncharacterized protein